MRNCRICVAVNCDCLCDTCEKTRRIMGELGKLEKKE